MHEKSTHNNAKKFNIINDADGRRILLDPKIATNKKAEIESIIKDAIVYIRETSSFIASPSMRYMYLNDRSGKETEAIQRGIASERMLESESDLNFIAGFHFRERDPRISFSIQA